MTKFNTKAKLIVHTQDVEKKEHKLSSNKEKGRRNLWRERKTKMQTMQGTTSCVRWAAGPAMGENALQNTKVERTISEDNRQIGIYPIIERNS